MTPRLLPDEPLPPYAHIPGRTPHPISDPAGHSFGHHAEPLPAFDPSQWPSCRSYLRGVDLFNNGYYWEAHEAWEAIWHAAGRRGPVADFIKGLIQLSVAGVKWLEEKPDGMRWHSARAAELWRASREHEFLGLRVADLIVMAEAAFERGWLADSLRLVPTNPPPSTETTV